ncbi:MAG: molybdopterin-dependent oxidoreductase, partial [Myxococcota bacterium]
MPDLKRRDFLKLVGVSAGGAAAAGCSDHVEKLIPYVVQPEEITPGIAVYYASTCQECNVGCGLHVRTREARPVKLEGNPDHPINRGRLCARGQAGIGRTFHPDRFRGPMARGSEGTLEPISWEDAQAQLVSRLESAGAKARMLGSPTGPTLSAVLDGFNDAVGLGPRVSFEPFAGDALREAAKAVFGTEGQPLFDLSDSDYVVDFGSDLLDTGPSPVEHARQLTAARDITTDAGKKARLVYVGPRLDTTAASSDAWLTPNPGSEGLLALGIAKVAFDARSRAGKPVGGDAGLIGGVLRRYTPDSVAKSTGVEAGTIERIGKELAAASRAVALPPGVGLTSKSAVATNAAVLLLDAVLGAVGSRVDLAPVAAGSSYDDVRKLVKDMQGGGVSLLLVHGANPVYSLPASLGFGAALEKVGFVVSFASLPDETSDRADLILPEHTPLESWGDAAP